MGERWRVGRSYGLHVYAVGPTSPDGDRPVATFHRPQDAQRAVEAVNGQAAAGIPDSVIIGLAERIPFAPEALHGRFWSSGWNACRDRFLELLADDGTSGEP